MRFTRVLSVLSIAFVGTLLMTGPVRGDPLMGQGKPPSGGAVPVYFSFFLEKLLDVNEISHRFQAVFSIYMSWQDDSAMGRMTNSTADLRNGRTDSCTWGCRSDLEQRSDYTSKMHATSCCDGVWIPSLRIDNLYGTLTSRHQPYVLYLETSKCRPRFFSS